VPLSVMLPSRPCTFRYCQNRLAADPRRRPLRGDTASSGIERSRFSRVMLANVINSICSIERTHKPYLSQAKTKPRPKPRPERACANPRETNNNDAAKFHLRIHDSPPASAETSKLGDRRRGHRAHREGRRPSHFSKAVVQRVAATSCDWRRRP
jgi:hypothetical protein